MLDRGVRWDPVVDLRWEGERNTKPRPEGGPAGQFGGCGGGWGPTEGKEPQGSVHAAYGGSSMINFVRLGLGVPLHS